MEARNIRSLQNFALTKGSVGGVSGTCLTECFGDLRMDLGGIRQR